MPATADTLARSIGIRLDFSGERTTADTLARSVGIRLDFSGERIEPFGLIVVKLVGLPLAPFTQRPLERYGSLTP
jgi:hypothetical protein